MPLLDSPLANHLHAGRLPSCNAQRSLYLDHHLLPLSYLSSLVPSYLYLREVGGDHAITSVYVPAYTRAKVITIDNSLLEEEASYFVTWATCSCQAATAIATSSACFVTSMRAYQRQLAAIAAQEEQDKRKREKEAADILAATRAREVQEAGNGCVACLYIYIYSTSRLLTPTIYTLFLHSSLNPP